MTTHTPSTGDAAGPVPPSTPTPAAPPTTPASPPRGRGRLGVGAIVGIAAAGVLSLGLVFGGGMVAAWALGPVGGHASPFSDRGPRDGQDGPPRLGPGGKDDRALPGQRDESDSDSGSPSGTTSGS